jgi:hypothetical protein
MYLKKGLSYQRLILVVQEKPDYSVLETGLSGFQGFKALDRPYPFTIFSLLSLSLSLEQP